MEKLFYFPLMRKRCLKKRKKVKMKEIFIVEKMQALYFEEMIYIFIKH